MNVFTKWESDIPPTEEESNYLSNLVFSSEEYKAAKQSGKRLITITVYPNDIKAIKKKIAKIKKIDRKKNKSE